MWGGPQRTGSCVPIINVGFKEKSYSKPVNKDQVNERKLSDN